MSGLVVGYGAPEPGQVSDMLSRINHRGPFLSGIFTHGQVVLGLNYLHADCPGATLEALVPCSAADLPDLRICYDGQIAGPKGLRSIAQGDGPFAEEQATSRCMSNMASNC